MKLMVGSLRTSFFGIVGRKTVRCTTPLPFLSLIYIKATARARMRRRISLVCSLVRRRISTVMLIPVSSGTLIRPMMRTIEGKIPMVGVSVQLSARLLRRTKMRITFIKPSGFTTTCRINGLLSGGLQGRSGITVVRKLTTTSGTRRHGENFVGTVRRGKLELITSRPTS